jgi:hypothetical protein
VGAGEDQATQPCASCFKTSETVAVEIRHRRGEEWVESTIRRCANDECWNTTGGTLEDRLTHIRNVYDYKYFGDYELSPEQLDAVFDAGALAALVPDLLEALKALVIAVTYNEPPRDFGTPDDPNPCYEARVPVGFVDKARAAIAKAEGRE